MDFTLKQIALIQTFGDGSGFYFIPGALTDDEQAYWIRESLISFPQPPNRTNHTEAYGPIFDLFDAVQNNKVLVEAKSISSEVDPVVGHDKTNLSCRRFLFSEYGMISNNDESYKSVTASVLLRKLRWSTLGLQFDWSKVRNCMFSFFSLNPYLIMDCAYTVNQLIWIQWCKFLIFEAGFLYLFSSIFQSVV